MRETPLSDIFRTRPDRITPAYAGNTAAKDASENPFEDHPRVCGKHKLKFAFAFVGAGSPPRMRETQKP